MIANFLTHWKTTVSGILSFLVTTLMTVSGFMGANDVNTEGTLQSHTKYAAYVTIALALCRAWIGFLQMDAGTTTAVTPSNPTPHAEPSHEIPDSPAAVPVPPAFKL